MAPSTYMTDKELASEIAKQEGKKVEVSIGNIREILRLLKKINLDTGGGVHSWLANASIAGDAEPDEDSLPFGDGASGQASSAE